jgi:N6-adenosine-specific RNA methylase IME4
MTVGGAVESGLIFADGVWFSERKTQHSVKPKRIHEWAETISTGPRLEMFARARRDGWDAWGLEAPEHSSTCAWDDAGEVPVCTCGAVPGEDPLS